MGFCSLDPSFIQFLPEWVKADRIIRKELKELDVKPIVPHSSFDPFSSSRSTNSISPNQIVSQPVVPLQKPHALVEVIEPSSESTSSHEILEVQTPQSLILINKDEPTEKDSLSQLMKRQNQALVFLLVLFHS